MKILLNLSLSVLTFISLFTSTLTAQPENPLAPEQVEPNFVGVLFGIGRNTELGTLIPDCEECRFKDGVKFGWTFGGSYEMTLSNYFNVGGLALFSDYGFNSIYDESISVNGRSPIDSSIVRHTLKLRQTANADIKTISFVPYIKFKPAEWMFLRLGLSVGFPVSHSLKHTIELTDKREVLPGDYEVNYEMLNDSVRSGLHNLNSPSLELFPQLGVVIPLTADWSLSPQLHYSIPLTNISDNGEDLKVSTFRFMLELRYIINSKSKIYLKQ